MTFFFLLLFYIFPCCTSLMLFASMSDEIMMEIDKSLAFCPVMNIIISIAGIILIVKSEKNDEEN